MVLTLDFEMKSISRVDQILVELMQQTICLTLIKRWMIVTNSREINKDTIQFSYIQGLE